MSAGKMALARLGTEAKRAGLESTHGRDLRANRVYRSAYLAHMGQQSIGGFREFQRAAMPRQQGYAEILSKAAKA